MKFLKYKTIAWLIGTLLFLVIASYLSLVKYAEYQVNQPLNLSQDTLFEVKKGQSVRSLGKQFEKSGWISQRFWLKAHVKFNPDIAHVKEGVYLIKSHQTLLSVINDFVIGKEHQFSITFIEGSRFDDWLKQLANAQYIEHTLPTTFTQSINELLTIDEEHPEGLLFPDTYAYTAGTKDIDILRRAQARMNAFISSAWLKRAENLPYETPYQALIMASIIEKETGQREEQPIISSVFFNRLHKKMRLQTDPTVIYGIGDAYDGDITRAHLKQKTRYNTYRINGLPPTPIAMPGKSAIEATLQPAETDYLYFVSRGNGWHQFSETLKQHNKAVAKYQLGQ